MTRKDYILIASLILNVVLGWIAFTPAKTDESLKEELYKSKGRVQILEDNFQTEKQKVDSLALVRDSLQGLVEKKPRERIVIIEKHDKEIENVVNLPIHHSVSYLSGRLSEVEID